MARDRYGPEQIEDARRWADHRGGEVIVRDESQEAADAAFLEDIMAVRRVQEMSRQRAVRYRTSLQTATEAQQARDLDWIARELGDVEYRAEYGVTFAHADQCAFVPAESLGREG